MRSMQAAVVHNTKHSFSMDAGFCLCSRRARDAHKRLCCIQHSEESCACKIEGQIEVGFSILPSMCEGGCETRPRRTALSSRSCERGRMWSTRTCGRSSARISRSSTSFKSRRRTPLRLMLCAVCDSKFGSAQTSQMFMSQCVTKRCNKHRVLNMLHNTNLAPRCA